MILGLVGTNGSGKGAVVEYLVQKGFTHYSVRDAIVEEITRRNLPVNRTNMNEVATDMRKQFGAAYYTTRFIKEAKEKGVANVVIESIRNPREAEDIKAHGGHIWALNADRAIRYERATKRSSETDTVSFEEFCAQEDRELTSEDPTNPAYMDMRAVIAMADVRIDNNGTMEELHTHIDDALEESIS